MRMSCNGCRVLRKGCSQDCIIRPCLQWLESPVSQTNATLFLAKFYGRVGLLNLIQAGPENLRPAIFRSLLYEACGRVVNPVYGSVGMLWSGNWIECQAAVDAVLKGSQITQTRSSPPESLVLKDIDKLKTRTRFKRSATSTKSKQKQTDSSSSDSWMNQKRSGDDSKEDEINMFSVEGSFLNRTKKFPVFKFANQTDVNRDIGLELTLG